MEHQAPVLELFRDAGHKVVATIRTSQQVISEARPDAGAAVR